MVTRKGEPDYHRNPGILLRASPEQMAAWRREAERADVPLSKWLRQAADELAERAQKRRR